MFNLTIDREHFLKSLLVAAGAAVEKKQPILANVLLSLNQGELQLTATDTEIEIVSRCSLEESVESSEITVQAKKLVDLCRSLPDKAMIHFQEKDKKLLIQSGKSKFQLLTLPSSEFPKVNEVNIREKMTLNALAFRQLIQSTAFAMAQEDIRVYLNGLLLESNVDTLTSAATDGHRLALFNLPFENTSQPFRIVLPRKAVLELTKILDLTGDNPVDIMVTNNHFYVDGGYYTFVTKLLNCQFPNYANVIPKDNNKIVKTDKDELKKILSRVSVLANEKKRGVCFSLTHDLLKVFVNNTEHEEGEDEIQMTSDGISATDTLEISFNINYVMDVLNALPSGEVKISCSQPELGVLFESEELPQARYLIMPMKL